MTSIESSNSHSNFYRQDTFQIIIKTIVCKEKSISAIEVSSRTPNICDDEDDRNKKDSPFLRSDTDFNIILLNSRSHLRRIWQ